MYERFLNKEVRVSYKFPMPTRDGSIGWPGTSGKLVAADAEGICLEEGGIEEIVPHSSIQTVALTTKIERAPAGLVLPNIRGG